MRSTTIVLLVAGCSRGVEVEPPGDVLDDTALERVGRWVDADWVVSHGGDDDVQIVDVRDPEEFEAAHVPGALNLPWEGLRAERDGVSGQVVTASEAEAVLRAAGVREGARVVAYDGRHGRDAARLVWTLAYYGHDASVVDGGWGQWTARSLPSEAGGSAPTPGDFSAAGPVDAVLLGSEALEARLGTADLVVLDVRGDEEFAAGHIPGAVHVEWTRNVHEDGERIGLRRVAAELEALYEGLDRDATVAVTCRSGARASLPWAVLPELGFTDVRLHDGSWNEWSAQGRPVER